MVLIRRLVAEAADAGVQEVFLTGGEPFLLPDLDVIVHSHVDRLPTTLLTNGMLFRGTRLATLRRMPRDGFILQISLDSATPDQHDCHRGAGSRQRTVDGIARTEGFRVRVVATERGRRPRTDGLPRQTRRHAYPALGPGDATTRTTRLRHQRTSRDRPHLLPEITVTADGVYWHPVGADHLDQLVTRELFPLRAAIDQVRRRFTEYRGTVAVGAERLPCA